MHTIFRNSKTVSSPAGSFLSSGGTYLRRIFPALAVIALGFVLAFGWGIGVNRAYANSNSFYVIQDSDDAEEDDDGDIDLTSSDLELVDDGDLQHVGMRFQNIDIPQSATITSAYIEFACDETGPTEATSLIFRGQAHNDAVTFTGNSGDISSRATTGAAVSWDIAAKWATAHERHQSPDLSAIIQEIVNRSGWNKNNALVIIVTGSGERVAESWNGARGHDDLTLAPKLFVEWDTGGGGGTGCEITFRDQKQAQSNSTTSLSVDKPSTEEGDLLIATVAFGNGDAVLSAPAGWTKIQPASPGSEMLRTHAWYKEVEAGEPGSYLFSASGSADEMLIQIASFKSSAGAFVLKWDLKDNSYNYLGSASTAIVSKKIKCVDDGLFYFAGSYDDAADVVSRPASMTTLSEQKITSGADPHLSLATYYELRDSGNNITKTIEWAAPEAFLTAIAAVFSCQSTDLWTISASSGINGSISPSGDIIVPDGGSETFAILPDSGYQVADVVVDGDSKGAQASYTFNNVKNDHTITAIFAAANVYVITTNPGSNGRIEPAGPVEVAPGADQTFSIIPDAGYVVDKVEVDGKKEGALTSYTFENVDDHHNISATFKVDTAAPPVTDCVEISDIPLEARFQSAAPNIMIALDDSGSMSFEMLVPGAIDGRYQDYFDYVFDNPCGATFGNPGCHEYDRDSILVRGGNRLHWKTQWAGYNKVYYDPTMDYEPWPTVTGRMDNADADNPRAHAMHPSPTFDLSSSYDMVTVGSFEIIADDEDTGIFTKTGPWTEMTGYSSYNDHYYAARNAASYTAVWTPYVPGGTYKVYARWTDPLNDRSHNVPYTIVHAGGTSVVNKDQSTNEGSWQELGIFSFNSGIAQVSISVTLTNNNVNTVCADAIKFVPEGTFTIDIPRAHYYVRSATDNKPYLVVLEHGFIGYHEFNDADTDDVVDGGELLPSLNPPADVKSGRSYVEERQNFANWYTYYRRRAYTATYATAELITGMQAVRIGMYGINIGSSWSMTPQPVVNIKNNDEDFTETLLNLLYEAEFKGGTPLRRALEAGGRYFDKHDNKKLDGTNGDDSPWATAADGGECQQAFTILITDGYYNGPQPQTSGIKNTNVDGDNGVPYADSYKETLADVAMYYYERDLNTDLANNVPVNSSDDATHQHMVTYSVGFGVIGMLDPDDYDADLKHKVTGDYIVWTDPGKTGQTPEKVDDLWHAAVNARGKFLNSSNPKQLVNALKSVLLDIQRRVFSSSGVAINGDELYQRIEPDLLMFQASYSSEGWTGSLKAYEVDPVTGEVNITDPEWSAAELLQSRSWNTRLIATYDGTAGIPFQFDRLTDTQKGQLDENWATDDTLARNLMQYLRGDTANEVKNGGALRNRFWVLGDIVHSSPVFKNDILYAGGNDGLLHAFAAETGEELFAYVPNLVFENLKDLADPTYVHRFYVDLTPTIEDVTLSGVSTMLVGGLGKGGRGYFALDLTGLSPTTIPGIEDLLDNHVMWEYPNAATPGAQTADLGYSYSKVALVRSNDPGAPWVVIFGNGYGSPNGHSVLFILNPETGTLLKRIDTLVGDCNGLSTPIAVDVDYNDTVDYVYAGDLKGNLWKFDLSAADYTQWDVAYKEGGIPKPLFQTPGQPITTKPNVMYHCKKKGYIVNFGTGRYLGMEDVTDTSVQAVYGIWDYGDDDDDGEYVGAFNGSLITNPNLPTTVSLLQQVVVDERTENGLDLRTLSNNHPDWSSTTVNGGNCGDYSGTEDCDPNTVGSDPDPVRNVGWYFNLPESGERVVSELRIRGGNLTVISYAGEGSTCGLAGHSWVMVMDACSGARLSEAHFDINGDGAIDVNDLINIGTVADPIWVVPTGVKYEGKLEPPAYLIMDRDTEKLYLNSSEAEIETLLEKTPRLGMTYWRVLRR